MNLARPIDEHPEPPLRIGEDGNVHTSGIGPSGVANRDIRLPQRNKSLLNSRR